MPARKHGKRARKSADKARAKKDSRRGKASTTTDPQLVDTDDPRPRISLLPRPLLRT